jgi:hypothetical protein
MSAGVLRMLSFPSPKVIECEQKKIIDNAEGFKIFLAERKWLRNLLNMTNECWNF